MKLTSETLAKICIGWFIIASIFISNNTVWISSIVLLLVCLIWQGKMKVKWNHYFTLECLFLFFCVFQLIFGLAVVPSESYKFTRRIIINFVSELIVYNLLLNSRKEQIVKKFADIYFVAVFLMIMLGAVTGVIFSGRFSTKGIDFSFLGLDISVGVGTTVGYLAASAFAVTFVYFINEKKKIYAIAAFCSLILVLLSATRKVLLVCAVVAVFAPAYKAKNMERLIKLFKYVIIAFFVMYLMMKIPFLYENLGVRIERTIYGFISGTSIDNSERIRSNLRSIALYRFYEKPLFGWGLGSFKELFGGGIYSHCNYTEILYSTGMFGALLFFSRYVYLVVYMVKSFKRATVETDKYYIMNFIVLFLLFCVMEYWQVTYYLEKFIIINVFILAMCNQVCVKKKYYHSE